jgi:hypothetical protein
VDAANTFNQFGQGVANNRDYGVFNLTSNAGTIAAGTVLGNVVTGAIIAGGGGGQAAVNITTPAAGAGVNVPAGTDVEVAGNIGEPIQVRAAAGGVNIAFGNPTLGAGFTLDKSNLGFYKRQQSIAFSAVAGVTQGLLTLPNAGVVGKNYYTQTTNDTNTVAWYILAKIRLKDMCDFFDKLPLVKGAYLRFIINVNTSQHTIQYNRTTGAGFMGAGTSLSSIQNIVLKNVCIS